MELRFQQHAASGWKCQTHRTSCAEVEQDAATSCLQQNSGFNLAGTHVCCCVQVFLYDVSGATLGVQPVGADHTSHVFSGLSPGHLYRSEVVTHSGELTNRVSAMGRTCKNKNRREPALDDSRSD